MKPVVVVPDILARVVAWAVVVPVALVAVAPEWLELPGAELEHVAVALLHLAIGVAATLWSAAALRPRLGIVIEDAFGRRSDQANAASGCTAMTYTLFGLAFTAFALPRPFDDPLVALSGTVGWVLVFLGVASTVITVRSVSRRNERDLYRRVVARARAEVAKGVDEALATVPPRYAPPPSKW